MQNTADGYCGHAPSCYDDGAVEDGDLSVIGLALRTIPPRGRDRRHRGQCGRS